MAHALAWPQSGQYRGLMVVMVNWEGLCSRVDALHPNPEALNTQGVLYGAGRQCHFGLHSVLKLLQANSDFQTPIP